MGTIRIQRLGILLVLLAIPGFAAGKCVGKKEVAFTAEIIAREKASIDAGKRQDRAFYDDHLDDMTELLPQSTHLWVPR